MAKPVAPQGRRTQGAAQDEDPTPTYNLFIRSTLGKGESANYTDQLQGLSALRNYDEKQSDNTLRLLSRLVQYGHINISGVQLALNTLQVVIGKDEKALMRIVHYLVLLALGDGSAGTPLPVPPQAAGGMLAKAVDRLGLEQLVAAWNDLGNEKAAFVRKQAALRALAAVTRASLTSRPDDGTYVQGLYETLRGLLDKVDALRAGRRGLAHFISQAQGNKKKNLMADIRQRAEMWGLLRAAFSAARVALTRSGLYKVAARSLSALGSSDPVCARHALALASMVARDPSGCGSFIAAVEPLLKCNVDAAKRTGALHLGIMPSKRSGGSSSGDPAASPDSETHLNLRDTWARVYLARACAAVIQSGHIAGDVAGRGAVFWQALLLLAVADPSEKVALEAIRAMFGAPYPRATTAAAMRQPGASTRLSIATSSSEVDLEASLTKILGASWHLVMTQALEQPPVPEPGQGQQAAPQAPPGAAAPSAPPPPQAAAAAAAPPVGGAGVRAEDTCVFGRIARRLMRCLQSRSHSLVCGAAKAVAVMAEARSWFHALSGGHGFDAEPEVVRRWIRSLHGFLLMVAGDDTVSGCERAAALEALVWSHGLESMPGVSPGLMLKAAAHGGFTAPPIARYTFADPWPECLLSELLGVLARRLRCTVGMPGEVVLELAGGLAAGSPAGMPRQALQQLWDMAPGPLAARSALQLLSAPLPPLCHPPAAAAVEVKALACQAEAAFNGLKAMAACWLGEHINSISGEYAWKPWEHKMGAAVATGTDGAADDTEHDPDADPAFTASASMSIARSPYHGQGPEPSGGSSATADPWVARAASLAALGGGGAGAAAGGGGDAAVVRLAAAAVAHNPLLAMAIALLHRLMLTGPPVVRTASAQALAKIAVRSGEPYRIQCYSLLAAAVGRLGGVSGGSSSSSGLRGGWLDPLGLVAVVGPALEVMDAMYAGELVLERHVVQYGASASGWPAPALESLRRRHEWLLGAIACCVCAVPRELFLPLGPRSRRLLFPDAKEEEEEQARAAAEAHAPASQQAQNGQQEQYDEYGQPYQYDYSTAEQYDYGDYYSSQQQQQEEQDPYGQQQDPLARYDLSGQKAAAAVELNWGGDQAGAYDGLDGANDPSAVAEARPGVVLYAFTAETEGEVSVNAGDSVRVLYDLGEWFTVLTASGQQGLVPASYIQLLDDHAPAGGGGGGLRGQGSQLLQSQPSISSSSATSLMSPAGGLSNQPSWAAGRQQGQEGGLQPSYGYGRSPSQSTGGVGGTGTDYYPYQYDNPEYDTGNTDGAYSNYYADYGTQYGTDQYGGSAYGGGTYGGGMYGSEGAGASAAAGGRGGAKKGGFGGFDDFGAVLAEAKTAAAAAARQQQSQPTAALLDSAAANSSSATAAAAADLQTMPSYSDSSMMSYGAPSPGAFGAADEAAPAAAAASGGRALAVYEFVAEMDGELSVAAGEELELLSGEMDGWYSARVVSDPSRQGLIPASYVQAQ